MNEEVITIEEPNNKQTFSIEEDCYVISGNQGFTTVGYKANCSKCKRKILVEMVVNGSWHHSTPTVTCSDCLKICDIFQTNQPEITADLEKWAKSDVTC